MDIPNYSVKDLYNSIKILLDSEYVDIVFLEKPNWIDVLRPSQKKPRLRIKNGFNYTGLEISCIPDPNIVFALKSKTDLLNDREQLIHVMSSDFVPSQSSIINSEGESEVRNRRIYSFF